MALAGLVQRGGALGGGFGFLRFRHMGFCDGRLIRGRRDRRVMESMASTARAEAEEQRGKAMADEQRGVCRSTFCFRIFFGGFILYGCWEKRDSQKRDEPRLSCCGRAWETKARGKRFWWWMVGCMKRKRALPKKEVEEGDKTSGYNSTEKKIMMMMGRGIRFDSPPSLRFRDLTRDRECKCAACLGTGAT